MSGEREEYLEADKEIPGQKFVCLSFLSPENVLANKDLAFFNAFLKDYEIQYKIKATESFLMAEVKRITDAFSKGEDLLEEIVSKINDKSVTIEDISGATDLFKKTRSSLALNVNDALEAFVKSNMNDIKDTSIQEDFETFMFKNRKKLEEDFFTKNSFRTTVRGLKIRGAYDTFDEASYRAKSLQKLDPSFNVFVGQMGFWLPWDPAASDISKQEYAEDQLNTLMKSYRDNESKKDEFFESQKRERLKDSKVRDAASAVIGPTSSEDNSAVKGMFDEGDLAIARKKAVAMGNTID
jgi:hypothetical protein